MKRLLRWKYARPLMAMAMLVAILPNALFLQHYSLGGENPEPKAPSAHAHHLPAGQSAADQEAAAVHCHVGPENCSASSGLSNAVVIAAALALTLLGGGVLALQIRSDFVWLFDLPRRLIVPPKLNLRSV
jgi:hypothetical protein